MKRNLSTGIVFLFVVLAVSACGGDDSETYRGAVVVTSSVAQTSQAAVSLSGYVDFVDNGTLSQISVSWSNAATGGGGDASVNIFCLIGCSISWNASDIPLAVGDNVITISAAGNGGHVFTPAVITVTRLPILILSGKVTDPNGAGLNGIPLVLGTQFASTNASGDYSFTVTGNNTYTIAPAWPSTSCYSFIPSSVTVALAWSDVSGQNFTASSPSACYTISGRIVDYYTFSGVELTVTLSSSGNYVRTRSDVYGNYSFQHVPNGTYTIWPSVLFSESTSPEYIPVTVNGADVSGQNFVYYH